MKRIITLLLFALFAVPGCSHDEDIPKGIMPPGEMSKVLLELKMAEAYDESLYVDTVLTPEQRKRQLKVYYLQILQLHHTDKEHFMKSYHFYESRPDLLQDIYKTMQDSIGAKKNREDSTYYPR